MKNRVIGFSDFFHQKQNVALSALTLFAATASGSCFAKTIRQAPLNRDTFAYKLPALGSGPVLGMTSVLPKETPVQIEFDGPPGWSFIRAGSLEGWVPKEALGESKEIPVFEKPTPPPKKPKVITPIPWADEELQEIIDP